MKPEILWNYFFEILKIPHGSGNEAQLRNYIIDLAKQNNLEYSVDNVGNLLVRKPTTKGYEDRKTVVLQSHLDMVCEKNSDVVFDFEKDPIQHEIVDGWLKAKGTTLGADNGIGVAAQLAILTSNNIAHGNLECLFTIEEETGLVGAFGLDSNWLSAEILLNLDGDYGHFFMGCAGGTDTEITISYTLEKLPNDYKCYEITVKGLTGGHSGEDINKGRENAIKLCNRVLLAGINNFGLKLNHFKGGNLHNAIPREATAKIAVPTEKSADFENYVKDFYALVKKELPTTEPNVVVELQSVENFANILLDKETKNLVRALAAVPYGVIRMAADIPNFVETSSNLAAINMENGEILITTSHRSSIESRKWEIAHQVASTFELIGAKTKHGAGYPGWTPNINSPILKIALETFKRLYSKDAKALAIHAGLECGLISEKYPTMDMISFGPAMKDIHSPNERVEIASVEQFWNLILEILKNIPKKA
ncbi:MAG: aminoacyl-histidine dipeptidase [Bacteroidales bacterium]|nr:aminoacyl-histidine dipeptidase [Bacteroidales bacterium]